MSEQENKDEIEDSIRKMTAYIAGDKSEENAAAMEEATVQSWPEIQQHLIEAAAKKHGHDRDPYEPYQTTDEDGVRVTHMSFDSWWLKDFDRSAELMRRPGVSYFNTQPFHVRSVLISLWDAYGLLGPVRECFREEHILAHIERFPQGQFAVQLLSGVNAGNCVGMATTMRASRPPTAPALPWLETIGDMTLSAHEPDGDWLYGVEMGVHRHYQRHGIGAGLYQARFDLCKRLNLRGMYAIGMLMGYQDYAEKMDVTEYGEKVVAGELKDPTVSFQLKQGFRAQGVVTDYCDEWAANNTGVLIVWDNPDYVESA